MHIFVYIGVESGNEAKTRTKTAILLGNVRIFVQCRRDKRYDRCLTSKADSDRKYIVGLTNGPRLGHIEYMSAIAKSRIDPELKRQAEAILEEIGLKPRAALELFYKQIIKRRAIPFPVQADSPEDEVLSPAPRRNHLADEF